MNPIQYRFDLLEVPGAENVRDIGGYPGRDGRPVRKGRFIRAGAMHSLTPDGVAQVRRLGISCIVDLRSTMEVRKAADTLAWDAQIGYIHVPMLDHINSTLSTGDISGFPPSMAHVYVDLLENGKRDFLRVFQVFADPGYSTVLYHCTAGKDRTGLSTMLLLGLAGVSDADILDDYSHSEDLLTPFETDLALPSYLFESKPATLRAALDHLDSGYGGIPQYLRSIGVTPTMEETLLEKLLG